MTQTQNFHTDSKFSHDVDGNLTTDGKFTYTWDAENRLTHLESIPAVPSTSPAIRQRHKYDDLGRLSSTLTELQIQNQWQITAWKAYHYDAGFNRLAETDISGANPQIPTARTLNQSYLWGKDLGGARHTAGGVGGLLALTLHKGPLAGTYSAFADGNGNILRLTNVTLVSTVAEYAYGPFGETLEARGPLGTLNPFRWSSKPTDNATHLKLFGYRWLNSHFGRWISRDPYKEDGGANLYGMVCNDPVGKFDILGLAELWIGYHGVPPSWAHHAKIWVLSSDPREYSDNRFPQDFWKTLPSKMIPTGYRGKVDCTKFFSPESDCRLSVILSNDFR